MEYRKKNLRNMVPSMNDGVDGRTSKAISGEASKDSLTGKNKVQEYRTGTKTGKSGALGGRNTSS